MIQCLIQLSEPCWETAIGAVSQYYPPRLCDCSSRMLANEDFVHELIKEQLSCRHIRNILPEDVSLYVSETPAAAALKTLRENLLVSLLNASPLNPSCFSLALRLDRIQEEYSEERLQQLALFMKSLLTAPLDTEYDMTLSIRHPFAFPKSREQERALKICSLARHPHIGLCLNVYPDDCQAAPDIPVLLSDIMPFLKCLCFHYSPMMGETLYDEEQDSWARHLKDMGYQGLVSFCPHINENSDFKTLCHDASAWSRYYQ